MAFVTLAPEALLPAHARIQTAILRDVNPDAGKNNQVLVNNMDAVWSMVRNLLASYRGANTRIFNTAYCMLYELLQEPYSTNTATKIELCVRQAITQFLPVVTSINRCTVLPDDSIPGYYLYLDLTAGIMSGTNSYSIPRS